MNINESNFAKDYIHKNTFMTNKRFHRDEYPFDILGEFGLTENMIYGPKGDCPWRADAAA